MAGLGTDPGEARLDLDTLVPGPAVSQGPWGLLGAGSPAARGQHCRSPAAWPEPLSRAAAGLRALLLVSWQPQLLSLLPPSQDLPSSWGPSCLLESCVL